MNASHRGMVRHILSRMTAKMIAGLTSMPKETSLQAKVAYIEGIGTEEIVELLKRYDLKIVKEAIRHWEIELRALSFLLDFSTAISWQPLRDLATYFAIVRYGRDHVANAIKLGEQILNN